MTPRNKAWHVFSEWLRRSSANDDGIVKCYTCPASSPWQYMHSGHCLSRKDNGVFINEKGVKPQCPVCNLALEGNTEVFKKNLIKEYGEGIIEELETLARKTVKMSTRDWSDLAKEYKTKLKSLK